MRSAFLGFLAGVPFTAFVTFTVGLELGWGVSGTSWYAIVVGGGLLAAASSAALERS